MKITGIETIICHARMRNWVFIKIITDQPGLYGWGEATLEWHTRSVVTKNNCYAVWPPAASNIYGK